MDEVGGGVMDLLLLRDAHDGLLRGGCVIGCALSWDAFWERALGRNTMFMGLERRGG